MLGSVLPLVGDGAVDADRRRTSKAIQRQTGPTFHLATRLLPARAREATYVFYAFFRVADEVVDDPDGPPAEQRADLARIRAAALGERETDDPVLGAFRDLCERHDVPDHEIRVFLDAMGRDVTGDRYPTYEDLEEYLRGSSVAVAYMLLAVLDPDGDADRSSARALGEAFQLTNFLRDVREDLEDHGRIYLPQQTLQTHDVTESDLASGAATPGFTAAMRAELRRAERRYRHGVAGIASLPEDCQFAVLLSAVLYAEHHRLIREQGYDVLAARPALDAATRLRLLARTWWHWRREPDPEAVFYRVGAVPRSPDQRAPGEGRADDADPDAGTTRWLARRLPAWLSSVAGR